MGKGKRQKAKVTEIETEIEIKKKTGGAGSVTVSVCYLIFYLLLFTFILCRPADAAVGDAVASCSSVAALGTLDVQPGAGAEWAIHNIYFEFDVELQRFDGTNTVATAQFTGADWQPIFPVIHVTNSNRIRLKNLHASLAKLICYDGVQTK